MLIDAPPPLLSTIIHKKHLSHFMAKTMNELAHKSPLICLYCVEVVSVFVLVPSANAVGRFVGSPVGDSHNSVK